jgi:hypothetical protein
VSDEIENPLIAGIILGFLIGIAFAAVYGAPHLMTAYRIGGSA